MNSHLPQTKDVYEWKQQEDDQAPDHGYHHEKMTEVIDYVIDHLDNPKSISKFLQETGHKHAQFK